MIERADAQRQDAAAILRLAAFHVLAKTLSLADVDLLCRRALSHVRAAERIQRGEA